MPINKGMSKGSIIQEILSSYKKKGTIGSSKPKNMKHAMAQASAIAYSMKAGKPNLSDALKRRSKKHG